MALHAYDSKALSWIAFIACCLVLVGTSIHIVDAQDKIALAMSKGQMNFFEAFEFRVYVSFGRYMLTVAAILLFGVLAAVNLIRLRKPAKQSALALSRN